MFSSFCRKKVCQGRKITKPICMHTQKQRRKPHHCQLCLPSVSSHCWSCKWQQISQWKAVLWKRWEVKSPVKGCFLPKVLILHFVFYVNWHLNTHTSLPVCFALHEQEGKKKQNHKRNTGVRDKYSIIPWNLKCNTARSKWQELFYMEIWCSSGVCSTFPPLISLNNMLMKPGSLVFWSTI